MSVAVTVRAAAVDCGTNALRWLIVEQGPDGAIVDLERELRLVRLGEGVDATGSFAPAALARTLAAVDECAGRIRDLGVTRIRFVATSAARDVANAGDLLMGVRERLGVPGEIITGAEEAELSFTGALTGLEVRGEPVLVTDIGGGSTELALGTVRGMERAVSLDVGSVRLTERFFTGDPPRPADVALASGFVDAQLATWPELTAARSWIAVGGTATTLAALRQGLTRYDADRVQGFRLSAGDLASLADDLCATPAADLVSDLVPPLRAQVIGAGALICSRIAARLDGGECTVGERDILDGIVRRLVIGAGEATH